ncbi:MAG: selenocysteine-specific translation elongation factor [Longimicrobiales bacterium]
MKRLILGTAGHIDHGKTSLVKALTGTDTDRLAEEKKRGITIELGFAQFNPAADFSFGVVDVPGHEGFIRTMVAGATGMDMVLLIVAADEGVMPQTLEHLAIVRLLGVRALVVALTKADLVEEEWLELVREDVRDLLAGTRFATAPIVPTSVESGEGMRELESALLASVPTTGVRVVDDLVRLPIDRVFTVEGAGTVVTGTLWSGRLKVGDTVRLLPGALEARVRRLQVHGQDVEEALPGQRTAVALTGASIRRGLVERGHVLVRDPAWVPSMMLTVGLEALEGTGWTLETGQRVRVHLGTVEVMARLVLFDPGRSAPVFPPDAVPRRLAQLRLEAPLVARVGDRFVLRSYSPMTTIAGGVVLEPSPPKRKKLTEAEEGALQLLGQGGADALLGAAQLAGWQGVEVGAVAVRAAPDVSPPDGVVEMGSAWFSPSVVAEGEQALLAAVERHHRDKPLDGGIPLEALRGVLPERARRGLADGIIRRLEEAGELEVVGKYARRAGFSRSLTADQSRLKDALTRHYQAAGLSPPARADLPVELGPPAAVDAVLRFMVEEGELSPLGDSYLISTPTLNQAADSVMEVLGGRAELGPAEFREVLPVTRKHLIPILAYFDQVGITLNRDGKRSVVDGSR